MNKLRYIAKVLKYVAKIVFYILKFFLILIPRLLRELFSLINKRLRFSITFKTTTTYTLIFTTILLVLGTLLTCSFTAFLLYESNKSLEKNSQVITDLMSNNSSLPTDTIKKYADIEDVIVSLFDENMEIIYTTSQEGLSETSTYRVRLSPTTSVDKYLHYETPVKLDNNVEKIEVAQDLSSDILYLEVVVAAFTIFFLLAVILTIIIGSMTSRKMLKPIDNMTRTARSISVGDLDTRLDIVDSHDELKELAVTFNQMLDRIQASFEQQNVFVSDASHELRTPISVIQGYANLLQRWGKEDKAVLEESIDAIKNESDYMKNLVEKLLFLASADKKNQRLETSALALNELIDEVLKETILIDTQHDISCEVNDLVTINGDKGLIKQAIRIFIDNSIKFTPDGGLIKINSSQKGKKALVTIEDSGMGIAPEDLPHIFNRFYKGDKSRTRKDGGAGLGLSIARWIIEKHQGEIKVESIQNQGTKITIVLPALQV